MFLNTFTQRVSEIASVRDQASVLLPDPSIEKHENARMSEHNSNNPGGQEPNDERDKETVFSLLRRWEDAYKKGEDIPAEILCHGSPELIPEVISCIAHLKTILFDSGMAQEEMPHENDQEQPHNRDEVQLKSGDEPGPDGERDTVFSLLLRWEDAYKKGEDIPAEVLCRVCPELIPEVISGIAHIKKNPFDPGAGQEGNSQRVGQVETNDSNIVPLKPGDEPWPGYSLIKLLGKGAFGEVWSARRKGVEFEGVEFALKVIRRNDESHLRTEREGLRRICGTIHPFVLQLYWFWVWPESLVIITELAGPSLEQHFEYVRNWCPPFRICADAISLLRDAAEALDFLLVEKKLMHLDIKPSNLLLVKGRCKLADFGTVWALSKSSDVGFVLAVPGSDTPDEASTRIYHSLDEVPAELTPFRPGETLYTGGAGWTRHYAPPERFSGRISKFSDQYSLALTFCELVLGRIPFQGSKEEQLAERQVGRMNLEGLPGALHPDLQKALSPRPEDRFPSCLEFISALRNSLLTVKDDSEARQLLIDVQDGGKWPGIGEEPSRDRSRQSGPGVLPAKSTHLPEERRTQVAKASQLKSAVVKQIRRYFHVVGVCARIILKTANYCNRLVENLATGCWDVAADRKDNSHSWRGTMIFYVLLLCLACVPVVILLNRIDWLYPLIPSWFENDMKESAPVEKEKTPSKAEPEVDRASMMK
jgi:serine/threonine protein kinase